MKAEKVFENINFKRGQNPKRALEIGMSRNWRIAYYEDSNRLGELEEFEGTIEEAHLYAAKNLLKNFDHGRFRDAIWDDFWATFSLFDPDKEWAGDRGVWFEAFDERLRFRDIDGVQLRFYNKLVKNDTKD